MEKLELGVLKLGALEAESDQEYIGAKAAHLHRAILAGHSVPAALVIPSEMLARNSDELGKVSVEAPFWIGVEEALGASVPSPWAVRSSGAAEDGVTKSFAGQFLTVLNVKDSQELRQAVVDCWESRRSKQVGAYDSAADQKMAVIIQSMVPADAAGVAFSADPVTGERACVVVNAIGGLGDRLVSGEATPESIKITSSGVARNGAAGILTDAQAHEIASLVRALEKEAGLPQDIEWAFENGKLWLLQARPITSLPPQPLEIDVNVPPGSWERDDHCPVVSEMGWDTWYRWYGKAMASTFRMFGAPVEEFQFARIGGNIYTQVKIEGDDGKAPPPSFILWLVVRLMPSFRRLEQKARLAMDNHLHRKFIEQWDKEWKQEFQSRIAGIDVHAIKVMSDSALLESLEQTLEIAEKGAEVHANLGAAHIMTVGQFALFCRRNLGWTNKQAMALTSGSSYSTTELTNLLEDLIWKYSDEIKRCSQFANPEELVGQIPDLQKELNELIEGQRLRILNYDLINPTIGEKPGALIDNLPSLIRQAVSAEFVRSPKTKQFDVVENESRKIKGESLRRQFLEMAKWAMKGMQVRDENGVQTYARPFGLLRLHILEIGKRIDGLEKPEDAFFLTKEELLRAIRTGLGALHAVIEKRKGEYQWAKLNKGPKTYGPVVPPPSPVVFQRGLRQVFELIGWMDEMERVDTTWEADNHASQVLKGNGVFAGEYTGIARLVESPADFEKVNHGEIMVCRITTGEWSLVFSRVGALVSDEGGLLSHPAIIAREFQLPGVVGVGCATRRIQNGDRITVDGTNGLVTIH